MKTRMKTGMVPPRGWTYDQEFRGQKIEIKASDPETLIRLVEEFRTRHGIVTGSVLDEIEDQICGRAPDYCRGKRTGDVPKRNVERFVDRVNVWLDTMLSVKIHYVSPEEATRRAKICATCPMNQLYQGDCPNCAQIARTSAAIIRSGRKSKIKNALGGCAADGMEISAGVHLELGHLGTKSGRDSRCWLRD